MQEYEVSGYLLSWIEDWRVRKDLPAGSQDAPDGEGLVGVGVLRLNRHSFLAERKEQPQPGQRSQAERVSMCEIPGEVVNG